MNNTQETRESVIDGVTYRVSLYPTSKALDEYVRWVKMFGPAFARAIGGLGRGATLGNLLSALTVGSEMATLEFFERLASAELKSMIMNLAASTVVVEKRGQKEPELERVFDTHFAGKLHKRLFPWVLFALQANYADFLDGQSGGALATQVTNQLLSLYESLKPSAGKSGESPTPDDSAAP
jgi:hypothetical protein